MRARLFGKNAEKRKVGDVILDKALNTQLEIRTGNLVFLLGTASQEYDRVM